MNDDIRDKITTYIEQWFLTERRHILHEFSKEINKPNFEFVMEIYGASTFEEHILNCLDDAAKQYYNLGRVLVNWENRRRVGLRNIIVVIVPEGFMTLENLDDKEKIELLSSYNKGLIFIISLSGTDGLNFEKLMELSKPINEDVSA